LKFWFQTGTNDETDDRNKNGIIDSIDDTTDLIKLLKGKGYADIVYREVEGGEHNPKTWGEVLPDFLIWAFGAGHS
jgi:enterochelin esterase-like enzyme